MANVHSTKLPRRVKDETGNVYGKLTVLQYDAIRKGIAFWVCRCKCGKLTTVPGTSLRTGNTRSCGFRCGHLIHGMSRTVEYQCWRSMFHRCYTKKRLDYKNYGGRGIMICSRWRESFLSFLQDMGKRPSPKHQIDRIDNDGSYTCGHCDECRANHHPANCRWSIKRQQARNRSTNHVVAFRGKRLCLSEWSDIVNIPGRVLSLRLCQGWSVERALTTPLRRHPRRAAAIAQ